MPEQLHQIYTSTEDMTFYWNEYVRIPLWFVQNIEKQ